MAVYIWEAKTGKGEKRGGELEAPDETTVRVQLRRLQLTPTKIKKKPKDLLENVKFLKPKVTQKDLVVFTRQLSTMIDAGLPLIQGLDILAKQQINKTFREVLTDIKTNVETGSTFADSLARHDKIFDSLFSKMVAAGELGGILDVILNRLAMYMEKVMKLKKKVKSALTYPLVVLCIAILVVAVILIFVIPVFQKMFADFGQALPAPTQIVINLSEFCKKNIIFMIAGLIAFVFAFRRFYSTAKGRKWVDSLVLRLPVFGPLVRKVAVAKFTRTLGTLISSGVPILDSLNIVAGTAGNKIIEEAILKVRVNISEGRPIAEPLMETGVFPNMVVQMITVGETTGALDAMLGKIADFYDDEVDAAVDALTSMIEPFMMVFLGGTIGGLVIAMYLPIFKMAAAVGN
ncbi:MAG: type II secretion system F family protein [Thermodesulfobacteriota bacterium]|nr:type II secretion system F family protein [Thermodesulfobacteriota bacterium]